MFEIKDGCWEYGVSYVGNVNYAAGGDPCLSWSTFYTNLDIFPDETWEDLGNKCR